MASRLRRRWLLPLVWIASYAVPAAHGTEIWEGLQEGDIIVQETTGPLADFLKQATGSQLTHVGIMRQTGGGPYVIDASPEHGVFEVPFDEFIARGVGGDYAVYRYDGLEAPPGINHPAILKAFDYYLDPYDPFYRFETSAFYGSELVRVAFAEAGVDLGDLQPLRDLGVDTPEGRAIFFRNWQEHPNCNAASLKAEACWGLIQDQTFITPASLADDPKLQSVFSTFD